MISIVSYSVFQALKMQITKGGPSAKKQDACLLHLQETAYRKIAGTVLKYNEIPSKSSEIFGK